VDLKDIKAIIDLMKKNSVSEFELEKEDFKIKLKRGGPPNTIVAVEEPAAIGYNPTAALSAANPAAAPAAAPKAPSNEIEVSSPMIGTFYRAPSPESGAYVEVGSEVEADTVVCIIEAMKVMNEIKAETKGVVTEVLVENAKPVEFGQALFKLRPA
jgi:acetyl-CoA carboxylase biotin carboxyl carrier protein